MIKAIIFDCFGVLTADGWLPFKEKYFKNNPKQHAEATRLNRLSDAGKLPYRNFVSTVSNMAGTTYEVTEKALHANVPNEEVLRYIQKLKKQYKIGFLSNVASNWLEELFTQEQLELFDALSLSYETGYIKPQPEAYHAIVKKLGYAPEECVFIDDQKSYAEAAQTVGIHGIHYINFEQMKADLEAILFAEK